MFCSSGLTGVHIFSSFLVLVGTREAKMRRLNMDPPLIFVCSSEPESPKKMCTGKFVFSWLSTSSFLLSWWGDGDDDSWQYC